MVGFHLLFIFLIIQLRINIEAYGKHARSWNFNLSNSKSLRFELKEINLERCVKERMYI